MVLGRSGQLCQVESIVSHIFCVADLFQDQRDVLIKLVFNGDDSVLQPLLDVLDVLFLAAVWQEVNWNKLHLPELLLRSLEQLKEWTQLDLCDEILTVGR